MSINSAHPDNNKNTKPLSRDSQSLQHIISDQEQIISELREQIVFFQNENQRLETDLQEIYNAFFWQITTPIRNFVDAFRKIFGIKRKKRNSSIRFANTLIDSGINLYSRKELNHQKKYCSPPPPPEISNNILTISNNESAEKPQKHIISIVVPLYNTPVSFLREMILSVQHQTYMFWELCLIDASDTKHSEVKQTCMSFSEKDKRIRYKKLVKNEGISANINIGLKMAAGDYIGLLDHDDILHPAALYEIIKTIENQQADFIYTDEALFTKNPRDAHLFHFKPDYAPDTLCSNNYICHFTVFKKELLDEVGFFDSACDGSQDHDMFLRLTEKSKIIAHIPEVMYYWRSHPGSTASNPLVKPETIEAGVLSVNKRLKRLGLNGRVQPINPGTTIYRVRYDIPDTPKVSILIWNYDILFNLKFCLSSILDKTAYPNYEILVLISTANKEELIKYLNISGFDLNKIHMITSQKEMSVSESMNLLASKSTGEALLFLSGNTAVLSPEWLSEMLGYTQRNDVGVVGAKLYNLDFSIYHAGFHIGAHGEIGSYFRNFEQINTGYMGRLVFTQNVSAVSADCMMIRKELFTKMKGMDIRFQTEFMDVDFCFRVRNIGYVVVWTPFASLTYYTGNRENVISDQDHHFFCSRWKAEIAYGDPYYNPNFYETGSDCFIKPKRSLNDARCRRAK